jgi:hypothetical protein
MDIPPAFGSSQQLRDPRDKRANGAIASALRQNKGSPNTRIDLIGLTSP